MAKAATVVVSDAADPATRVAILERGTALLSMIAAAPGGYLFLTQDEGADIVAEGNAVVTLDPVAPDGLATVVLTDAGKAVVAALPAPAAAASPPPAASPLKIVVRNDLPVPEIVGRSRGRASRYPFDTMQPGESFHIPKTAANPDPAGAIASSLTGARLKYAEEVKDAAGNVVTEKVKVKQYQLGPDGKRVKDADGHFIPTGEVEVDKPKLNFVRDFVAATVGADDPDGEGARIWRSK
jgi:hypothetical protein